MNENDKLLFPKCSTREENTLTAEFLHGHSLRFRNFKLSVGEDDCDICECCEEMADSVEHQLFECPLFDCDERHQLLTCLGNNVADFRWRILTLAEDNEYALKLFKALVMHIDKETEKLWEGESADISGSTH